MSYTPTTWVTGDTVTATKMNKIENGIAGAGGAACIKLSAAGFSSGSKTFGYIVTAYQDNDNWIVCSDADTDAGWIQLLGYAQPNIRVVCVPLPSDDDVGLFLVDNINDAKSITGDISSTGETLHWSWGSVVSGTAYRITGNGTFQFIAN